MGEKELLMDPLEKEKKDGQNANRRAEITILLHVHTNYIVLPVLQPARPQRRPIYIDVQM